jgi:hypothetical protein
MNSLTVFETHQNHSEPEATYLTYQKTTVEEL